MNVNESVANSLGFISEDLAIPKLTSFNVGLVKISKSENSLNPDG
jgi:hypothetical protein